MKLQIPFVILTLSSLSFTSNAVPAADVAKDPCAQPSPAEMAKEAGVTLPRYPWHLANIWWNLKEPVKNFESLSVDVTIDRNIPEDYNLYIAPVGVAHINGLMFYGGMQTNVNGWVDKKSRTRVHKGNGGIFSRWSSDKKTPIGLDHVTKAAPECLVESAGYEGEFASVRRPFKWKKGTYTYQIRKAEKLVKEGKTHTWFECRIKQPNGEWISIGKLLFEGEDFTYWAKHSCFVEVYSTEKIRRSPIPVVNVTFGWPQYNGIPAEVVSANAVYPNKGGTAAPDCAIMTAEGSSIKVAVGKIFKRDPKQQNHALKVVSPETENK